MKIIDTKDKLRFFLKYERGECKHVNMEKNKISGLPKEIASFLHLDNVRTYTGHALRRTSATFLYEAGGSVMDFQQFGGWESVKVAEGYVNNSNLNKSRLAAIVADQISVPSKEELSIPKPQVISTAILKEKATLNVNLNTKAIDNVDFYSIESEECIVENTGDDQIPSVTNEPSVPSSRFRKNCTKDSLLNDEPRSTQTQENFNHDEFGLPGSSTFSTKKMKLHHSQEYQSTKCFFLNNCSNVTINYNISN